MRYLFKSLKGVRRAEKPKKKKKRTEHHGEHVPSRGAAPATDTAAEFQRSMPRMSLSQQTDYCTGVAGKRKIRISPVEELQLEVGASSQSVNLSSLILCDQDNVSAPTSPYQSFSTQRPRKRGRKHKNGAQPMPQAFSLLPGPAQGILTLEGPPAANGNVYNWAHPQRPVRSIPCQKSAAYEASLYPSNPPHQASQVFPHPSFNSDLRYQILNQPSGLSSTSQSWANWPNREGLPPNHFPADPVALHASQYAHEESESESESDTSDSDSESSSDHAQSWNQEGGRSAAPLYPIGNQRQYDPDPTPKASDAIDFYDHMFPTGVDFSFPPDIGSRPSTFCEDTELGKMLFNGVFQGLDDMCDLVGFESGSMQASPVDVLGSKSSDFSSDAESATLSQPPSVDLLAAESTITSAEQATASESSPAHASTTPVAEEGSTSPASEALPLRASSMTIPGLPEICTASTNSSSTQVSTTTVVQDTIVDSVSSTGISSSNPATAQVGTMATSSSMPPSASSSHLHISRKKRSKLSDYPAAMQPAITNAKRKWSRHVVVCDPFPTKEEASHLLKFDEIIATELQQLSEYRDDVRNLIFDYHSYFRKSIKETTRKCTLKWFPQLNSQNAEDVKKTVGYLLLGKRFVRAGDMGTEGGNPFSHECIRELVIKIFYGTKGLAKHFPEDFAGSVPERAILLIATSVSVLLKRLVSTFY
ncbi:hypothetical protein DXG01_010309 [Tephrocybe rancida]|nr:hypothetical protein DXG01_010309 [Tephrocybe rancida]